MKGYNGGRLALASGVSIFVIGCLAFWNAGDLNDASLSIIITAAFCLGLGTLIGYMAANAEDMTDDTEDTYPPVIYEETLIDDPDFNYFAEIKIIR